MGSSENDSRTGASSPAVAWMGSEAFTPVISSNSSASSMSKSNLNIMNILKSGFRLGAALPLPLVEGRDKNISHVRPIAVGGKPRRAPVPLSHAWHA